MQIPEPLVRFWRETVAPRPIAAGSAAAIAAGLTVGGYLAAGAGFEPPPPMKPAPPGATRRLETTPQPITFMKDADGKSPDWVVGTDNIPGRKPVRTPAPTVPDPEDRAEAPRGRGLGWLLPWRWGRSDERRAEPQRPSRRIESDREAERREARERERERERYERYAEAREQDRYDRYDRYERYADADEDYRPRERRPRYEPRYPSRYEPPPEPRWWEDDREPVPPPPFRGR